MDLTSLKATWNEVVVKQATEVATLFVPLPLSGGVHGVGRKPPIDEL